MSIPEFLKKRVAGLPPEPGCYLFKDRSGAPVYIGKANSLRKRVSSHFRAAGSASKMGIMLGQVTGIDFIRTATEAEALLLEASLVKQCLPRFNSELKDDKSYPYLKITAEEYPRLVITRQRKADGGKYFGPYTSGWLLRQAVRMLRRLFPLRTCRSLPQKVCLMYHIGQCRGPCEFPEAKKVYDGTVKELERFLEGRPDALVRHLARRMKEYAAEREYEKAQALYEEIKALGSVARLRPHPLTAAAVVLASLQKALGLDRYPSRIEGFDISNVQGAHAVGSMVVFAEGRPSRAEYRHFRVRTVAGIDDYRMMAEIMRRRYTGSLARNLPLPDLILIDGGKGHLAAAKRELDAVPLGVPVISIAKQHEHLFKPGREGPFIFPQDSPYLELIRRLRDESHRFAIRYYRKLHRRSVVRSALDGIPGVGPRTKAILLKKVGSVNRIQSLSEKELAEKAGIREMLAHRVLEALRK